MDKRPVLKLDNRGASLIMVIIAIVFVAAMGTIAVSIARLNTEMKTVDRKSKYNFYSAEAALDEIKIGLSEDIAATLSEVYQVIMTKYSTKNTAMRKEIFRNEFIDKMKTALGVSLGSNNISLTELNNYLQETKRIPPSSQGAEVIGNPLLDSTSSEDSVTILGLEIIYTSEGFTTLITTDIKINIPKEETSLSSQTPFKEFALIADEALNAQFTDYNIMGNVYAGSHGINTSLGKSMRIIGSRIITKGDILVKDMGKLDISGVDTEVWANNLVTSQTDKVSAVTNETNISIRGNCYIKDDLVLDAKNSHVTLLEGEYYGYSNGLESDGNSAIVVNASDAYLDLSGLRKLYLAGRAHISLEDGSGVISYYLDEIYGAGAGANCNIQTGESLVLKGSQNGYLLPCQFITLGHNPVSWSEYKANFDLVSNSDQMVSIPSDSVVFENASITAEESKLLYYLKDTQPVKKAFYKFGTNDNVVYYYLNFKSEELATTYFKTT